jgi:glycosyltransferase involved in cell wall biosynthesis
MGIPMVVTDMSMIVQGLLPKMVPTTFGTPALVDQAKARGHRLLELLLPPVDTRLNAPGAVDPEPFRRRCDIQKQDITIVTVSRLDTSMKAESLVRTIHAVEKIGEELPLKLILVGDGNARPSLEQLAEKANAKLGRTAVQLTGALLDPRPAYAAADIVIGMGGSALRGMAFGKPVLIVGERGFSLPFNPDTAESFYYNGIYGLGDGDSDNTRLVGHIRELAENAHQFPALGEFSRKFVVTHFALETVSSKLVDFFHVATAIQPRLHLAIVDGLKTATVWVRERRFMPRGRLHEL